jgi:hypothetical protein
MFKNENYNFSFTCLINDNLAFINLYISAIYSLLQ